MDTIFMNSGNSKTFEPYRLLLNLADKIELKRRDKYVGLSNLSMNCTWKNIKKSYINNKSKIFAPPGNKKFELSKRSYFISDI